MEVPRVAAARVGCCVLVWMYSMVRYFLHNYEMLAFPDIKMHGNGQKKLCRCRDIALSAEFCRHCRLLATCRQHVADMRN
jgi:hypothetical protein